MYGKIVDSPGEYQGILLACSKLLLIIFTVDLHFNRFSYGVWVENKDEHCCQSSGINANLSDWIGLFNSEWLLSKERVKKIVWRFSFWLLISCSHRWVQIIYPSREQRGFRCIHFFCQRETLFSVYFWISPNVFFF